MIVFLWTGTTEDSGTEYCRRGVWEVHKFTTGHFKFKMPIGHPHGDTEWP